MKLKEQIIYDYKVAMKARNISHKEILSFVIAQIKNKEIDTQKEVSDAEVIKILQKEVKTLDEAMVYLEKANKQDDISTEKEKKKVLNTYLPKILSEPETKDIIEKLMKELDIQDLKTQRGLLMKELMGVYAGQVDGSLVNQIIQTML